MIALLKKVVGQSKERLVAAIERVAGGGQIWSREEIRRVTGIDPVLPPSMEGLDHREETFDKLENNYEMFRDYLISNYAE